MKLSALTALFALGGALLGPVSSQVLHAPDAESGDDFGKALHAAGDLLVVGAPKDDAVQPVGGAAYIYRRSAGQWSFEAKVVSASSDPGDLFGTDVHTDGTRVIVGAPRRGNVPGAYGSAHVYESIGGVWTEVFTVTPPQLESGDRFGGGVAIEGDVIVVSAHLHDETSENSGVVFTFEENGGSWSHVDTWTPADTGLHDRLGWDMDLDQGRLAVSAVNDDDGNVNAGAVYLASRSGASWAVDQKLVATLPQPNQFFGTGLDLDQDDLIVGSTGDFLGGGAAWVYIHQGGAWGATQRLESDSIAPNQAFGHSVAISSDRLVVGAPNSDVLGPFSGRVHSFQRTQGSIGGWARTESFVPAQGAAYDFAGLSVALTDSHAFIGSFGDNALGNNTGAVYVVDELSLSTVWVEAFCLCGAPPTCGNYDVDAGCANGTGRGARVTWTGTPSIAAQDLRFGAVDLPPLTPVIGLIGQGGVDQPLGDGRLCVAAGPGGLVRLQPSISMPSGTIGQVDPQGTSMIGIGAGGGRKAPIQAGETWAVQFWYRDPGGPCGTGENVSNAVRVTFRP